MIFGLVPTGEAAGTILAHSLRIEQRVLKKGRVLNEEDVAALLAAGRFSVTVARLEPGDAGEDEAASRVARAIAGSGVSVSGAFTGRANLFALARGLAVIDQSRLDRLNMVDEAVTVATLSPFAPVAPRQMVATVKIIPFAVSARVLEACLAVVEDGLPPVRVAPFQAREAGLIQTRLPGLKPSVIESTVAVTRARLAQLGATLTTDQVVDHEPGAVETAIAEQRALGCEPILILGASAIVDRRDVLPAAIVAGGGEIVHFGMPVDPGNLLLLGRIGATHVIGLPGCARSPKLNGIDWVLQRLAAGLEIDGQDIMRMGAGGLLTEISQRPLPRATAAPVPTPPPDAARIAAIVLAAGRSSRMGGANKLLSEVAGGRMVARVVRAALASDARPVIVVLGHDAAGVRAALTGLPVTFVDNPHYAQGLSTSLKAGIAALPDEADGALVLLGDMPKVTASHLDRLIAAYNPEEGREICVPTHHAKRGNPVLWARRFFAEMAALAGDTGARALIGAHAELVGEVEMGDDGVLIDVDTPEALSALLAEA